MRPPTRHLSLRKPVPSPSTQSPAAAPIENTAHQPHHIPFDNDEYTQPTPTERRYNLRSKAANIIQATMALQANNTHPKAKQYMIQAILDKVTGKVLEYRKYKEVWTKSYANELGRLTQGIRDIPGTNTMSFIHRHEVPADRLKDVTFGKIVTDYRPHKAEPNRSRLTVVGTYIDCPWDVATPTSDLITAKLLFNSASPHQELPSSVWISRISISTRRWTGPNT
jgi:hypothetical protein